MEAKRDEFGIEWSNRPPKLNKNSQYRLLRLGNLPRLTGIVLSHMVTGTNTHWSGNNTKPHFKSGCQYCERNSRLDWHGYIFLMSPKTREICLFELKPGVADRLGDEFDRKRTLRGLKVHIVRRDPARNTSQQYAEIVGEVDNTELLPKVPSVIETLHTIWGCKPEDLCVTGTLKGQPVSDEMLVRDGVNLNGRSNGQFLPDHD